MIKFAPPTTALATPPPRRVADRNVAGDNAGNGRGRAGDIYELAVQAVLLKKTHLLRGIPNRIAGIDRAVVELDSLLGGPSAAIPNGHSYQDRHGSRNVRHIPSRHQCFMRFE